MYKTRVAINSDQYLDVTEALVFTGGLDRLASLPAARSISLPYFVRIFKTGSIMISWPGLMPHVEGTPMDLRSPRLLGDALRWYDYDRGFLLSRNLDRPGELTYNAR